MAKKSKLLNRLKAKVGWTETEVTTVTLSEADERKINEYLEIKTKYLDTINEITKKYGKDEAIFILCEILVEAMGKEAVEIMKVVYCKSIGLDPESYERL